MLFSLFAAHFIWQRLVVSSNAKARGHHVIIYLFTIFPLKFFCSVFCFPTKMQHNETKYRPVTTNQICKFLWKRKEKKYRKSQKLTWLIMENRTRHYEPGAKDGQSCQFHVSRTVYGIDFLFTRLLNTISRRFSWFCHISSNVCSFIRVSAVYLEAQWSCQQVEYVW